jgi:hypothetical protein
MFAYHINCGHTAPQPPPLVDKSVDKPVDGSMTDQSETVRATSPYLMRRKRSLQEVLIQHKRPVAAMVVVEPPERPAPARWAAAGERTASGND